uniref:RING-type domain-containing protein n=1 Tax=Gouania willdenowi TaxID=441366 RepID=A0A8C5NEV6_GOUWI
FSCHCCYDILLDPTTLSCGHSFCRHCVAQWWNSSKKKECPECREKWQDFPKTNILLRFSLSFIKQKLSQIAKFPTPCTPFKGTSPVLMLMCHGSSCERNQQKKLSCKAVPLWTAEEILYRLEQMGPWTHPYRKTFLQKKANGR